MKSPKTIASLIVLVLILVLGLVWMSRRDAVEDLAEADPVEAEAVSEAPVLEEELIELLETSDMSDPAVRERIAGQVREREEAIREATHAKAKRLGIPIREELSDGTIIRLKGFDGDLPIYYSTDNANAAISSGAAQIRTKAPYALTGKGVNVGVWDGGAAHAKHQELSDGDVEVMDKQASINGHATHVTGTITAKGVHSKAQGMAPASSVKSYDSVSYVSEMLLAGAGTADETKSVSISNHSYSNLVAYRANSDGNWYWYGTKYTLKDITNRNGAKIVDRQLGRYSDDANTVDTVAYSLPYLTSFFSSGNERGRVPPKGKTIQQVLGNDFIYDPATSPRSADDRGGFENIKGANLGKNIIAVGAVNDAVSVASRVASRSTRRFTLVGSRAVLRVSVASRSLAGATMSDFSSWGPTDDGRIKPDIVANGVGVYSPIKDSTTSYASWGGTSMATPSAAGSAALLAELYQTKFKERLMPSSLMKALLIHTADDLGTPGPDYSYGWGLINVKAAADIILDHKKDPEGNPKLIEGSILADKVPFTHYFQSDGTKPIRATLCWTDPAGPVQGSDSRTPVLSHNLDLIITGPNGEIHQPFKMPYVGDWSPAKLSAAAIRGKNDTDNVEQVYDQAKPTLNGAGLYKVTVSLDGSLKKGISKQNFSLVLTGGIPLTSGKAWIELDESLDFGDVVAGTSRTLNLKIRNVAPYAIMGEADLKVTGIEFPGNPEMSGNFQGDIIPGATAVVPITYTPKAAAGPRKWFGTLGVLCNSAQGSRTVVPLGRNVQGNRDVPPQLRLAPQGVQLKENYISNLARSEWSYDWPNERYTNRFSFNTDGTVRIIVGDSFYYPSVPGKRTSDVKAGYKWSIVGPNQIAIYDPKKTEYSSDALILKFTSTSTFEATDRAGKAIQGRQYVYSKYGEAKTPESYTENLAGMVFNYFYWTRKGNSVSDFSTRYEQIFGQFLADGKIKPYLWDDKHGLWDNVTWKVHAKNVVRLSNASTGKEIYMHVVASAGLYRTYVAVGWEGNNMQAYFSTPWITGNPTKDLTERQENPTTANFGGIEMVWKLPENNRAGYWLAKEKTTQSQWYGLLRKMPAAWSSRSYSSVSPVTQTTWEEVREWIKKMKETHPLPAGTTWSTEPEEPLYLIPGQLLVDPVNGFKAKIVR